MDKNGGVFGAFDVWNRRKQYCKRPEAKESYMQHIITMYAACIERTSMEKKDKEKAVEQLKEELNQTDYLALPRVVISLSNRCTLRCRDCNALIPYAKEKYDRPVVQQIEDIKKLLKVTDRICNIELIGGEPFLYKDLADVLSFCLESSKIDWLEITTNGTLMPSEQIMSLMKNDKCFVIFSDYGDVNKKSKKIQDKLIREGIHVINLANYRWYNAGGMEKRGKSMKRIRYEFAMCDCKDVCRTLYRGKLYVCGRAPILHETGKISSNDDFLDLDSLPKDLGKAKRMMKEFFMNDSAQSCDFCDYASDSVQYVSSGIQL